jgi:5-methylthioadenosine/S-adenosylhomocysteine deaminase
MDAVLTARWVLPIVSSPIPHGGVRIRDGRILRVGPAEGILSELGSHELGSQGGTIGARRIERLDFPDGAIVPGLVNAHAHLDLTILRGFVEERDFFAWIQTLLALKTERLAPGDLIASARWGALELLRGGVTTVGDTSDTDAALEAMRECGLRGIAYAEVFGSDERECAVRLRELEGRLEDRRARETALVRVGVSPHSPYTVSAPLFRRVASLSAEAGLPLAVHAAESEAERLFVTHADGPFAALLRERSLPVKARGPSTIAYLQDLGVLDARPLLIHGVRLGPADLQRIRDAGASVAHCPKSNAKLGHGIAPLAEILALGIPTGIGTDGAPSSNGCDLLEEARMGLLLQRTRAGVEGPLPDARAALRLLTLGGAEALGLGKVTGSLEPGKSADLAVFRLAGPRHEPVADPETSLVFSGLASDAVLTMVEGRVVFREGTVLSMDEDEARADLRRAAAKLEVPPG